MTVIDARTNTVLAAMTMAVVALCTATQAGAAESDAPQAPVVELVPPESPIIGEATVMALACDESIREIGFWVDGRFVAADDSPPFELTTDFGANFEPHTVRALAVDRHQVVIGEASLELNSGEAGLIAEVQHTDRGVRVRASATPGSPPPVSFEVYAGGDRLAAHRQPSLELSMPREDLHDVEFLRLAAEYDDGSRLNRYLVLHDGFSEAVDVNEVQLWVTVTDRRGEPILDLEPDAFAVTGAGLRRSTPSFHRPPEGPLTLGVILDGSDSMANLRSALRESTETLATQLLSDDDRLLLFDVAYRPRLLNPGGDPAAAVETLDDWVDGGGSALYDSLYFAIRQLARVEGRRALVLMSDGADLHSHLDTDRVAAAAWRAGVPVFLISGKMPYDATSRLRAYNLQRFADATGGRVFSGGSARSQEKALQTVLDLLRSPYVLPLSAAETWDHSRLREVRVELPDPKLEARVFLGGDRSEG